MWLVWLSAIGWVMPERLAVNQERERERRIIKTILTNGTFLFTLARISSWNGSWKIQLENILKWTILNGSREMCCPEKWFPSIIRLELSVHSMIFKQFKSINLSEIMLQEWLLKSHLQLLTHLRTKQPNNKEFRKLELDFAQNWPTLNLILMIYSRLHFRFRYVVLHLAVWTYDKLQIVTERYWPKLGSQRGLNGSFEMNILSRQITLKTGN